MKKFTLMMIATFVAVSGMAIGTQKHAVVKNFMNKNMMTPYFAKKVDVSGGIAASQSKANTIKATATKSIRTVKDAEPAVDVKSLILANQYIYDEYLGGMLDYYPVTESFYLVDGTSIALELNGIMTMEGTIGEGVNEFAEYGAEVVTFKAGEVVATIKETGEELKLYNCDWDKENYVPVPNTDDIVGYIFYDEAGGIQEIFIPAIIAVVGETSGIVAAGTNYDACTDADAAFFKTTVTGTETNTSTEGGEPIELEKRAFYWSANSDGTVDVLVEGISGWDEDAWFKMTIAADGTTANIKNQQFVGSYTFRQPEGLAGSFFAATYTATGDGHFQYVEDGMTLNVTMNDDGDIYKATDGQEFCAIGYFNDGEGGDYSGYIYSSVADLQIKVTNEPAEGVTAIKEVNNTKTVKNAATYNLAGQKVGKDYKGMIIRDGKKFIVK